MRATHVGKPVLDELDRACKLGERIGVWLVCLREQGFSHDEAIVFISGMAYEIGVSRGDTWISPFAAKRTVEGLLIGRGAKHWTMDLIGQALDDLVEMC